MSIKFKSFGVNSFYHSLVLVFVCTFNGFSQEAAFKNYNEQNGLPSSEVYQVFQDREGFIWFATDNGVARFDGAEFKVFNKSNGLSGAVVFSLSEDSDGNLWFRTLAEGISVYKNGKMTPYKFNDLIKSTHLHSVAVDSLDQVYFSDWTNFFKITSRGAIEPFKKILPSTINILQVTKNDFLVGRWATGKALFSFFQSVYFKGRAYSLSAPPGVTHFYCQPWREGMYLSVNNLLFRLQDSEAKLVFTAQKPIISLSVDKEDNFWVGFLGDGVVRFSASTFHYPQKMPLLRAQSVTSVLQDNDGGFWFSTLEKGVYYLPNTKIINYDLPEDSKMNFALSNDENIFIGFYNGTLLSIDKRSRKKKWSVDLHQPITSGVFLKNDSLFWISTSHHSVLLNKQGRVLTENYTPLGRRFNPKKFCVKSDRIWCNNRNEAFEFDLNGNLLSSHRTGFWCRNIFVNGNDVYLTGVTGLRKTDKSFQKITEIGEFSDDKISDFTLLPGNKILVSTVGSGFKIIDGEKIRSYSKKDGLIFESVYATAVDSSLWLGAEKGLLKVDLKLLLDKGELSYDLLDKSTGLVSSKVNFISRNGNETWCFSNDGFSVFDQREIHFANKNLIPRLNRVTVNSNPVDSTQLLDLSYRDNNIGFDFGFQSYNNKNIFLRHRSSSLDQWNYTEDFIVNYYSLAPGIYKFDVEYSTDHMHWKKIIFPNAVNIKPVWWETIYFRLIILLITGLIFFIYFRAKYKSRLLKLELADQLKSEKERIAQDLHDNIGSRLVSLSLGLNHVVKEYEIESSTAEQIYSNVNSTVSELRDTIWAIQKEGVTIAEFCDKLKNLVWRLRQNNNTIHYDLQIKTEHENLVLKPTQVINLYRIIQEAITNSQKHSEADVVLVNVYEDKLSYRLCIKVEDNGRGFVVNDSQLNEHYGLKNMRARAEEIRASFEISSQVEKGTQVLIALQLSAKD